MAMAFAIFLFSLAGIPPLAGFFAKFYVFYAAIDAGLYALALVGVLATVVGSYYYLRIIKVMYFDEPVDETPIVATTMGVGGATAAGVTGGAVASGAFGPESVSDLGGSGSFAGIKPSPG